jgi:hypothetical protein
VRNVRKIHRNTLSVASKSQIQRKRIARVKREEKIDQNSLSEEGKERQNNIEVT